MNVRASRRESFVAEPIGRQTCFGWVMEDPEWRLRGPGNLGRVVGWTDIDEGWAVVGGTEMRISCKPAGVIIVGPQDVVSVPQEDTIRRAFDELVEAWFEETMLSSSLREICSHWAYQRVIGMGSDVVPLILEDIGRGRRHWGWALTAITGENPAEDTDSPKAAAEAWLRWGRQRGLYAYDAKPMD